MSSATATASKGGKAGGKAEGEGEETKKGGKKKLFLLIGVVVLVGAAAAYWFLFRSSGDAKAAEKKPAPVPGEVLTVDPISINLADGHYLKIGLGLQEIKGATEVTDGSKALDAAIMLYSGKQMNELSDPGHREELKKELVKEVTEKYEEQVYDVYFTSYVMQ